MFMYTYVWEDANGGPQLMSAIDLHHSSTVFIETRFSQSNPELSNVASLSS